VFIEKPANLLIVGDAVDFLPQGTLNLRLIDEKAEPAYGSHSAGSGIYLARI
jgi:hypothetical protein